MSRYRVNIDRLTLRGLDAAQRRAVVESLQSELPRILAEAGSGAVKARRVPVLRLHGLTLMPGAAGGQRIGAGIARAVGRSVRG
jgi:hypothetical protein